MGFPSVRASSNSQSSHTDFAKPFPVLTPEGLQSPPGLFSKCQQPPLLSFRGQELQAPLDWQQVGVSAALPGAGRLRADTFPRAAVTGRAVGPSHKKGSLLQLKLQPKTSSPGCWGMPAIQMDFGETINSPQSKAANSHFPAALSQPLITIQIQGGFVPDLGLGVSRNPLTTVPVAPAVSKPSKPSSTGGSFVFLPPPLALG